MTDAWLVDHLDRATQLFVALFDDRRVFLDGNHDIRVANNMQQRRREESLLADIHVALQFFDAHRAVAVALGLVGDDSLVAGFPVNE